MHNILKLRVTLSWQSAGKQQQKYNHHRKLNSSNSSFQRTYTWELILPDRLILTFETRSEKSNHIMLKLMTCRIVNLLLKGCHCKSLSLWKLFNTTIEINTLQKAYLQRTSNNHYPKCKNIRVTLCKSGTMT